MADHNNYLEQGLYSEIQRNPLLLDFLKSASFGGMWSRDLEQPENEWRSPEFWLLLGIDPSTKSHRPIEWQDLIDKNDYAVAIEYLEKHCTDPNYPYDHRVRYRHANGSTIWLRCRGIAVRNTQGKAVRMIGTHTNLTDLTEIGEPASNKPQKAFFSAIDSAPIAMIVTKGSGELLHLNQAAETLFSRKNGSADSLTISDIFGNDLITEHEALFNLAKNQTAFTSFKRQLRVHAKMSTGELFETDVDISLTYLNENPIAVCSVTNLSAILELNSQLKQSNEELLNFAYIASHDLQGPARRTASLLGFLKEDCGDQLDSEANGLIDRSIMNLQRMQSLVISVLSMSQLQSQSPQREPVNISQLVSDLATSLKEDLVTTNTKLSIAADFPSVDAEPTQVSELFGNLIDNALKYSRDGEHFIEIGWVPQSKTDKQIAFDRRFSGKRQPGYLTIYVTDNGIGIGSEHLDKIFEMFARLHSYDSKPGNGIGLAVCKRIVERHGGRTWLESEEGVGSTFYFNLPMTTATS
jgi:signal transduction histidine kinase